MLCFTGRNPDRLIVWHLTGAIRHVLDESKFVQIVLQLCRRAFIKEETIKVCALDNPATGAEHCRGPSAEWDELRLHPIKSSPATLECGLSIDRSVRWQSVILQLEIKSTDGGIWHLRTLSTMNKLLSLQPFVGHVLTADLHLVVRLDPDRSLGDNGPSASECCATAQQFSHFQYP
jgi:hypothetical protein